VPVNGWFWVALFFVVCAVIVAAWLAWAMKHVPYIRTRTRRDHMDQLDALIAADRRARMKREGPQ
jgi:hypothetical protein